MKMLTLRNVIFVVALVALNALGVWLETSGRIEVLGRGPNHIDHEQACLYCPF